MEPVHTTHTSAGRPAGRPHLAGRSGLPTRDRPISYAGLELQVDTGVVRLRPGIRAVRLSGQQTEVLAVLIAARGRPLDRETIAAAMRRGYRPPTARQIGVVISHIRARIGATRILTEADGWWLPDPENVTTVSYAGLCLDVDHKYVRVASAGLVRLGPQEFAVLRTLIEAHGSPRRAGEIWSSMRPDQRPATPEGLRLVIHHLRRRIGRRRIITCDGWRLVEAGDGG
ncbi:helix-turn-helix domain-containing protein [Micromonospora marina]|uniref:helix-turn-helix domain-containing protein n=1 Tax=Micromonospora marina TaxID=307120 RepID=UPI003453F4BB